MRGEGKRLQGGVRKCLVVSRKGIFGERSKRVNCGEKEGNKWWEVVWTK